MHTRKHTHVFKRFMNELAPRACSKSMHICVVAVQLPCCGWPVCSADCCPQDTAPHHTWVRAEDAFGGPSWLTSCDHTTPGQSQHHLGLSVAGPKLRLIIYSKHTIKKLNSGMFAAGSAQPYGLLPFGPHARDGRVQRLCREHRSI